MFYSDSMLTKKGPLANIWLAAHWDKKLSKTQIVQTDINDSVHGILEGDFQNMALRLSGQLLLGVSKIYDRKARYLLEDCSDTVGRIKSAFKPGVHVDLPAEHTKAPKEAITLPTATSMDEFLMSEMELDIDELLRETTAASQAMKVDEAAITLKPGLKGALNMKLGDGLLKDGFGPLDEIPDEIDMDLEMGRRATGADDQLRSDPLSIEQGRRDSTRLSEKFDELQFSPMRTPTKAGLADPFNEAPFHEYDMDFDMNPEMMPVDSFPEPLIDHPNSDAAPVLPPSSPVVAKMTPKPRRQRKIHSSLELDEQTEISNADLQANLRNTSLITVDLCKTQMVLPKNMFEMPLVVPDLNSRSLGVLFKARQEVTLRDKHCETAPIADANLEQQEELPFHEYEMDYDGPTMEPIPQTPLREDPNDENRVPDLNRLGNQTPLSGLQSPLKRLALDSPAKSVQSVNTTSTFSRNTIETLAVWKAEFKQAKGKSLDLESDLMVALSAGQTINKRIAAGAFFEALVLRGKGMVTLKQEKPFSPISIRANPSLFSAAASLISE